MKSWFLPVMLMLGLLAARTATATATDATNAARQDFAAATQAFHKADYAQALNLFLRTRAAGMNTPTLHYNLGVTYYHLQRYAEAEKEFRGLLADRANAPVANYNLGLIAMQRGQRVQARAYFISARDSNAAPQLRNLAAAALARLGATPASAKVQAVFSLSAGYDDNVAVTPEADITGVSNHGDSFVETLAAARVQLSGTADNGVRLDAGGLLRSYQDLNRYNLQAGRVGLSRLMPLDDWAGLAGVSLDTLYLDGERFQNVGTLTLQATRPVAQGRRLQLRYRASRIDGGSRYEYVTGWRQRLGAELFIPWQRAQGLLGYELELNNRRDLQQSAEFFSQSPRRHAVYAELRVPVSTRLSVNARATYLRSDYSGTDVHPEGATVQSGARKDKQWQTSLQANYRFNPHWQAFARYTHTNNDSNFSSLGYRRNEAQAGVELQF